MEFATTRDETTRSKGGVAIYVKDNIQYKHRSDISIFIPNILEAIFIEIKLGRKNVIIGTVYRPNSYPKADLDIC